ncbi:hypothetical protein [Alkaliflexus imshenetskii]|uniref:hypothetical protein n=1 Tax=Alkaliflexus imshenetskii TaxID=286730 RepID=UPI00047AACA0|nr:hypothetical protein [Alkaliflexus imshenetskii]
MKKKIFFAIATGFFAVATVFNMNALQSGGVGDISLDAITVMAQAQGESGGGSAGNGCPSAANSDCVTDARGNKYCQHVSEPNHSACS